MGQWMRVLPASILVAATLAATVSKEPTPSSSREWVAGPDNILYQFHVGAQNWLAAREHCLTQNADLVAIRSEWQKEWLLAHYQPNGSPFRERLIQVGLLALPGQMREWQWVNGEPFNTSAVSWIPGEPFEHTMEGREKCAVLRVSDGKIDDIDCELNGDADGTIYRFICERTADRHVQQQRSTNYLWSRLEALIELFGLKPSGEAGVAPQKPLNQIGPQPTPEDYEDQVLKLTNLDKEATANVSATVSAADAEKEERQISETLAELSAFERSDEEDKDIVSQVEGSGVEASTSSAQPSVDVINEATTTKTDAEAEPSSLLSNQVNSEESSDDSEARKDSSLKAQGIATHAEAGPTATLRELTESSGEEAHIEKDDATVTTDATTANKNEVEELDKAITIMETALEAIEKMGGAPNVEAVSGLLALTSPATIETRTTEKIDDITNTTENTQTTVSESKTTVSPTRADVPSEVPQGEKLDNIITANAIEADFTSTSKDVPIAAFSPEDDCEEDDEETTSAATLTTPAATVLKISPEKEKQIDLFLGVLREFLDRSNRTHIAELLSASDKSKTLLERMREAIKERNDAEFSKFAELETAKKEGKDMASMDKSLGEDMMEKEEKDVVMTRIKTMVMDAAKDEEAKEKTDGNPIAAADAPQRSTQSIERPTPTTTVEPSTGKSSTKPIPEAEDEEMLTGANSVPAKTESALETEKSPSKFKNIDISNKQHPEKKATRKPLPKDLAEKFAERRRKLQEVHDKKDLEEIEETRKSVETELSKKTKRDSVNAGGTEKADNNSDDEGLEKKPKQLTEKTAALLAMSREKMDATLRARVLAEKRLRAQRKSSSEVPPEREGIDDEGEEAAESLKAEPVKAEPAKAESEKIEPEKTETTTISTAGSSGPFGPPTQPLSALNPLATLDSVLNNFNTNIKKLFDHAKPN